MMLGLGPDAFAFESTKVLPKGVRNLKIRTLFTDASQKTSRSGDPEPIAEPLWKPLKFRNVLSSEEGLKRKQIEALLIQQGWDEDKSIGDFRAELNAQINVWAPIFAFGLTDRLTLAVAVPYYNASTDIQPGFKTNEGAEQFLAALTDPVMNNTKSAIESAEKLQNAIGRLNNKLVENNYRTLDKWTDSGVGDTTLLMKYLAHDGDIFKVATTMGIVAPTGKQDSPDILTDLTFGDGQWDGFAQLTFDQVIGWGVFFNQYYKYTYQRPDTKATRLKTYEETIEVVKEDLDFKLGDKIEAGVSMQFTQESTGITGGLGLDYFRKYGDRYETDDIPAKNELQRDTDQNALYWKAQLGYSTLPAFRRNEFGIPLQATIEYRKQYTSQNTPITDFTQIDIGLFF